MASKSKSLGLAADIFEQDIEGIIRKIPLSEIQPSTEQPRTSFDDTIANLAESLKTEGLLQPIVVTKEAGRYKIIAGERRYRAAKLAGFTEIECRILRKNAKDTYRLAVIENLQRENLDPIDEARAFRKLKNEYSHNDSELAKIVGKSRNYVNEILSVAEIPAPWIERAKSAGITSKNFFIQFAQAVKSGNAENFLSAFKSGTVSSVAAAKAFNKSGKSSQPPSPGEPAKPKKATVSGLACRVEQRDKRWRVVAEFDVVNTTGQSPRDLEKQLHTFISKYFG